MNRYIAFSFAIMRNASVQRARYRAGSDVQKHLVCSLVYAAIRPAAISVSKAAIQPICMALPAIGEGISDEAIETTFRTAW